VEEDEADEAEEESYGPSSKDPAVSSSESCSLYILGVVGERGP
jgi:hypothetical protein